MAGGMIEFQTTPNPNAVKCVVGKVISERPRSYFKAEDAGNDELARTLFAIPGVTNVLIQDTWLTVCKSPEADWKAVKRGIERALGPVLSGDGKVGA